MKITLEIWTLKLQKQRRYYGSAMDIKITSITQQIMEVALEQAREGRFHIWEDGRSHG